jgi:hypothetical protein
VPTPRCVIADRSYDARKLRDWLAERGCEVVIPPHPTRKNPHPWDPILYRTRNVIERMFCRLKDYRRIATRYDKRADTFLSAVLLAATPGGSLLRGHARFCGAAARSAPVDSGSARPQTRGRSLAPHFPAE